MDKWVTFLQDKWLIVLVAIVVIFLVMKLIKTFVKWLLVLVVVGLVIYYGAHYSDKLNMDHIKYTIGKAALTEAEQQFTLVIAGDAKDAEYTVHADGSYTVTTSRLKLQGKPGSDQITVEMIGQTFLVKLDDKLQKFIDQARRNG